MVINLLDVMILIGISITSVGMSLLWRTSIYTRGGIFRPIGRLFDSWVYKACEPTAGLGKKLLRFIAYPLGYCVYCSSFHITYYIFFLTNYAFDITLNIWYLIYLLPITHIFVIATMKYIIVNNTDMIKNDWSYMINNRDNLTDLTKRASIVVYNKATLVRETDCVQQLINSIEDKAEDSVLTDKELADLEICKSGRASENSNYIS